MSTTPSSVVLSLITCLLNGPCRERMRGWLKHNMLATVAIIGWFVTTGLLIVDVLEDPIVIRETVTEYSCPPTPHTLQDDPPSPPSPTLPPKPDVVIITRTASDINLKEYVKNRLKTLNDPD